MLYLRDFQADTPLSLLQKLLLKSGERLDNDLNDLDIDVLYPVLMNAAKDMGCRRVAIVMEIERGIDLDSVLNMVKSIAKSLAVATKS